ncbi:MAG: 2Fe-2S iron-sulfur cluster binding domain-containing protein [Deltaproteobacteria bacterium]|nr:2Fe-2S iron-sulfur cluster binding domain-containing protein [Deltaproteobacteria bacterium]
MPRITFLPSGTAIDVEPGTSILEAATKAGVALDHACGGACACSTCHVIVAQGYDSLPDATDEEEDQLDEAVGLTPHSRLGCQARVRADVTVEIPRHSRNLVSEGHG